MMYLAYKYVAVALMVAELNSTVSRMDLTQRFPIKESDLSYSMVAPPNVGFFRGRISTDRYTFSFSKSGRLQYIWELKPFDDTVSAAGRRKILESGAKSLIDEKVAYQLASNWLSRLSVDVHERRHGVASRQEFVVSATDRSQKNLLPIFMVKWGKWDHPSVDIEIDGRSKGLLSLRFEDDSLSVNCPQLGDFIKAGDALTKIADYEFMGYSEGKKAELLARYSANHITRDGDNPSKTARESTIGTRPNLSGNETNRYTGQRTNSVP
jgi:hypothetical protein